MRRAILLSTVGVVLAGSAGAAGWLYLRPHDPLAEARQLMAQGNLRSAQLELRNAVRAEPNLAEAHLRLGQVQLALGDPTAAEKDFRAAREHGTDARVIMPLLARAMEAQGHHGAVLSEASPDGLEPAAAASVLVSRAEADLALRQPDAAKAAIEQAQGLTPKSVEVALAAARLALVLGDTAGAETQVSAALAIDPKSLDAMLLKATLQAGHGDRAEALASYNTAIKQVTAGGPGSDTQAVAGGLRTIRLARAGLLITGNESARAREDVDAVLAAEPKNPMANYLSARLYASAGDWKAANAALMTVGPVLARLPRSDVLLSLVKINVGEPEQALEAAQRQVARAPADLEALKLLARVHLAQQRPEQAADVLAAAAAAGHADADTLALMGQIYANTGQPQQALKAIQQASDLAPDDARLLTRLAALELREGNSSGATQTLERALDLAPTEMAAAKVGLPQPVRPPTGGGDADAVTPAPASAPSKAQTAATLVAVALQAGEIDHALAALDRLRQTGGEKLQIALLTGLVKLAQIDLSGARTAFEEARRIDPASVPARVDLSRVLALQGHPDDAAALLNEVLATDPANGAVLGALVALRLADHQPEQAVAAAEAAYAAKPEDVRIVTGLAELYTRVGQPAKAMALLDGAAKQGGTGPALIAARVRAQVALGQRAEAAAGLRSLLDQAPDNPALRLQLVDVLATDKNYDGARTVLRTGLARHPADPTLMGAMITIAGQQGGPDAATAQAAELAEDPANGAVAKRLQGDLLLAQHKYAAAATTYQSQLAGFAPDSEDADLLTVRIAGAVAAGGDPARATVILRGWLGAHPHSTAALPLGELDIAAHRLPDAAAHLQMALADEPDNAKALNNLAWVSQQLGDLDRAHRLASRAYLMSPTAQAADTLAWVMLAQYAKGGRNAADPAAALALLREAARGLPGDPVIKYHLAAALADDGQKEAARAALLSALTPPPGRAPAVFREQPAAVKLLHDLGGP